MDILRDQFWNGVGGIAAIGAIIIEVTLQRDKIQSLGLRVFVAVICALGGIAVMAIGPLLQEMIHTTLVYGLPVMLNVISNDFTYHAPAVVAYGISFGLFPGTVTAMVALTGRDRSQRAKRAIIAAIASLIVVDTLAFALTTNESASFGNYVFAIVSNFIGGAIAGYLISLYVGFIVRALDVNE